MNNPIEIQIFPDRMDVLSYPGPLPPLDNNQLRNKRNVMAREYRNRRIGDILKELNLTEGRGTGIPIVYHSCEKNGSPVPSFETNEERTYFLATLYTPDAKDDSEFLVKKTERKDFKIDATEVQEVNPFHEKIILLIQADPYISRSILSKKLRLSVSTIQRILDEMKTLRLIARHGSYKGYWEIL